MNNRNPQGRWKSAQYDYDALSALDDDDCCLYALSARDVQLILASVDYFGWKTRYISPSNTAIDQDTIDAWKGHVAENLMSCLSVRQNPENPCQLQQENEDGTWTTWANLRLCPPKLRLVNGMTIVEMPDGSIIIPEADDNYDGREAPYTPPPREDPEDDAICLAAANAENVFYQLHAQVYDKVFVPDYTWAGLTLGTIIVGILMLPVALAVIVAVLIAGGGMAILSGLDLADYSFTVRKQFRCLLIENADYSDGVVTFDFDAVLAGINAKVVGINIWAGLALYLNVVGQSGLNRAGATTSITEFDCGCDRWCWKDDFTTGTHGYSPVVIEGLDFANYVSGQGWQPRIQNDGCSNHAYVYVTKSLGFTVNNIDHVKYTFANPIGGFDIIFFDQLSGGGFAQRTVLDNGVDTVHQASMTAVSLDGVGLTLNKCGNPEGFTLVSVEYGGVGDNPFGDDNC